MSPEEELRLRALELAVGYHGGDPVDDAQRFYAFLKGETSKSPRQIICEALEAAGVR